MIHAPHTIENIAAVFATSSTPAAESPRRSSVTSASVCRFQDVISPLLRVGDLRKQGVTLHLEIENNREEVIPSCILYYFKQHITQVGDVAAIYFVKPDEATVQRIAADVGRRL